jgi:putative acetyltransferase
MQVQQSCEIRQARFPDDAEAVRTLFREYAAELNVDLCFQGFEAELAGLPGKYAPPGGCVLLAECDGHVAGCIALRPFRDNACEMKRLYVRPEFRGRRAGEQLARAIIERGRAGGYDTMVLDTLATLTPAIKLYEQLGFARMSAYYPNPLPGVVYMALELKPR